MVTRREFLSLTAAAAGAVIFSDHMPAGYRSAGRRARKSDAQGFLWTGDATQTTVEVSSHTEGASSVGLAISPSPDMSDATFFQSFPPNPVGWNKWSVSGLSPGTRYYASAVDSNGVFFGSRATFWTLQPIGVPCTIRLAAASCAKAPTNPAAFNDIVAWAPDRFMHLGDFGYPQNLSDNPYTHMRNWAKQGADVGIRAIQDRMCMDYIASDHDTNGGRVGNRPSYHDVITQASIAAWREVVPARMEDPREPPMARFRADIEGNIRFVKLDTRSLEKSDVQHPRVPPNWPGSTMLGQYQLDWLKAQIDAAVDQRQFILVYSDTAWNGVSPWTPLGIPLTYGDKWPSYLYERDAISDYVASAGAKMFIVHGDTHGLQQDDGTNEKNGYAVICSSPLDAGIHMHYQDWYQWNYPSNFPEGGGPYRHAQQYQRLTIAQDPDTLVVTVTAEARDCSTEAAQTPRTVRTMVKQYEM